LRIPCPKYNITKKILHFPSQKKLFFEKGVLNFFKKLSTFLQTRGCGHIVALPFTLKYILRQKKNHGNSNISPC
jgi:hypothetical protein